MLNQTTLAVSARLLAMELALDAIAERLGPERKAVLAFYDLLAEQSLDRLIGTPVDEEYLELLRLSLADMRRLFEAGSSPTRS